ncbi:hypothetical protein [Arthrobacter sp. A5]|uniref:hypothetical protein n=1 Tax=Arthrobacter sp. A5 TaxID=576926 RepID=UPI003DA850D3
MFRRRRAAVGALLVLVILGVLAGSIAVAFYLGSREGSNPLSAAGGSVASSSTAPPSPAQSLGSSSPAASGTAGATPSEAATATGTATSTNAATSAPTATAACAADLVTVSAAVDATVYPAGQDPLLTLKVTNGSKVPCTVNVGTSQMEFLITSGKDRIFSSKDCQADATDLVRTIAPGASESANFPWSRIRSAAGCPGVAAVPGGGGAYYMLTATLGTWSSAKVPFQLQ